MVHEQRDRDETQGRIPTIHDLQHGDPKREALVSGAVHGAHCIRLAKLEVGRLCDSEDEREKGELDDDYSHQHGE